MWCVKLLITLYLTLIKYSKKGLTWTWKYTVNLLYCFKGDILFTFYGTSCIKLTVKLKAKLLKILHCHFFNSN